MGADEDVDNAAKDVDKTAIDHDLRGLAYFGNLADVYAWKPELVDPLQKSNTPLLKRPSPQGSTLGTKTLPTSASLENTSNVMVLDDFANGYHDSGYDGCQGATIEEEAYILEQWQRVEVFNYFTHRRVGIPPPTWINAGHRNGALVLGTFNIESRLGDPQDDNKRMLEKEEMKYKLASILTQMADCYGFDGWFINIESRFLDEDWAGGVPLRSFLEELKNGLAKLPSGGKVVW